MPRISKGDYLIVSARSLDTTKTPDNKKHIEELHKDYNLAFHAKSPFAFPAINLKSGLRYLISIGAQPGERFLRISRHKPNMEVPDYYVFVKK